jgi:hypothetical protein
LVWDDQPLFPEPIEAWDKGPVVPELWERCASRSGAWLSELTHREPPWIEARARTPGARNPIITQGAMRAFFATYQAPLRRIPDAIARGLDLVVALPKDIVADVLRGEPTEVVGIEEWLETGEGDPWRPIDS